MWIKAAEFCTKYPALARLCDATPENTVQYHVCANSQRAEDLAQKIPADRLQEFWIEAWDPQAATLAPTAGLTEDELNLVLAVCETMSGA